MNSKTLQLDNHRRKITTVRLTDYEKNLIKKHYQSLQQAMDELVILCRTKEDKNHLEKFLKKENGELK